MASSTRARSGDDQWKDLDNKIQELSIQCSKKIEASQASIEQKIIAKMDQLMTMVSGCEARIEAYNISMDDKINGKLTGILKNVNLERVIGRTGESLVDRTPLLPSPGSGAGTGSGAGRFFKNKNEDKENQGKMSFNHPKVELTHFKGEDPRAWIRKCNKFF